jgi:hypothetical protein
MDAIAFHRKLNCWQTRAVAGQRQVQRCQIQVHVLKFKRKGVEMNRFAVCVMITCGIAFVTHGLLHADPFPPSDPCAQGCDVDRWWKIDGECIQADVATCCTVTWSPAPSGSYTITGGGNVDHWKNGIFCEAFCTDVDDSVSTASNGAPYGLYGSWPECRCDVILP